MKKDISFAVQQTPIGIDTSFETNLIFQMMSDGMEGIEGEHFSRKHVLGEVSNI